MIWLKLFFISTLFFNSFPADFNLRRAVLPASADEIISAVNALRSQYGLAPYTVDQRLMGIAQAQSEYQASIGTNTHTRPDGSDVSAVAGISAENINEGTSGMPASTIIQRWTADSPHTTTMIGFRTGVAGAGAATDKQGIFYYTLDVTNTGKALTGLTINVLPTATSITGGVSANPAGNAQTFTGLITATPMPDGSIIHIVSSGQTLSGIATAYNLTLNDLINKNHISDSSAIKIGQKLIIRVAPTPTLTVPPSPTQPTATLTATPGPSAIPTEEPTATPARSTGFSIPGTSKWSSATWTGIGLGIFCVLGLGLAFLGWRFNRK